MWKDKSQLRREMKERRRAASDRASRDAEIFGHFFSLPKVTDSNKFFIYMSFGSEADTRAIIAELIKRGKEVYLPRVEGRDMVFVRYTGQALQKNVYGIEEPAGAGVKEGADVIVLPMLAADRQLHRLGYGGGYYDRFLQNEEHALKIGICYDFQRTDELFAQEYDIPADVLVTDRKIYGKDNAEEW